MTLSYLTGVVVSGRVTPGAVAAFLAISLYINSKQAFVLWMRRKVGPPVRLLAVFLAQVLFATIMLLPFIWSSLVSLTPYVLVPLTYLFCLKFLGEHSVLTEIAGFALLSLSALIAKLTISGILDPVLFTAVAVFFIGGVFKVRVQLKKNMTQRVFMFIYIAFAIAVYRLINIPLLVLVPLSDNLIFSITLYQTKLRVTGWLEVVKGVMFLLLMALSYH